MFRIMLALLTFALAVGTIEASEPVTTAEALHAHVAVLADDSLEGRRVGEIGEEKAALYIEGLFREFGLQPAGDNGEYRQPFPFVKKIDFGPKSSLTVNGTPLTLREDYLPMPHSSNEAFDFDKVVDVGYGIILDDSSYNDYAGKDVKGKAVLVARYSPADTMSQGEEDAEPDNPHRPAARDTTFDGHESLVSKILTAIDQGAGGVFFYTPSGHDDTMRSSSGTRVTPRDLPIVFLKRTGLEKLGLGTDSPKVTSISGETDLFRVNDTGYNIVGLIPGETDSTIIIGAHYDHLGYGGEGSRYMGTERLIHNGADDNGSGSAALLELARYYGQHRDGLRHSLLFLSFSGEEYGLLGSSYYAKNWTVDRNKVLMMVNMDMVGRLREQDKGLAVFGTGTCAQFKEYFDNLDVGDMKLTPKESGTGPSDHTAFYNDSIPVLHFFTGAHDDYHKPSDDTEKLDYDGMVKVTDIVADAVNHFDHYEGQLVYERTKTEEREMTRSFSVTLGIMPDYVAEVKGLRVDGVSPDRPGDRAGLLKGDVVIQMGPYEITDIYDYMNALGKFRKGDSTVVVVDRSGEQVELTVNFN